jgi:hypothetical protein
VSALSPSEQVTLVAPPSRDGFQNAGEAVSTERTVELTDCLSQAGGLRGGET